MKQQKAVKASLEHLVFFPSAVKSSHPAIVALHGRGTNELDLLPLVDSVGLDDVILVAPRAPHPFNTRCLSGGFAWYKIGQEGIPHPQTFRESLGLLQRFLREIEAAYPVNPERLVLLGFSQGTIMAYAVGLLDPEAIRGIAALSGYVPNRSGLPLKLQQLNGLAIFISQGAYDEIIPVEFGRESAQLLKAAGADVVYNEYLMGHEVREETLRDLDVWLKKLIS